MNLYERAAEAWKIKRAENEAALKAMYVKQRNQFVKMLEKITGTDEIEVYGESMKMYAIVEGIEFVPELNPFDNRGKEDDVWMVRFCYVNAKNEVHESGFIFTAADLGYEIEKVNQQKGNSIEPIHKPKKNKVK